MQGHTVENRTSNCLVEILRLNVRPLLWKPETECQDRLVETVDWIYESLVHRRKLNIRQSCEKTEKKLESEFECSDGLREDLSVSTV